MAACLSLVCMLMCFRPMLALAEGVPEPDFSLYAQSAVLMDGETGRVLYEKNGYEEKAMASTTKIMTCILALELSDVDTVYTTSSYAASMPKVKLGVMSGESYRLLDLLHSLMLESHNDTAVVIAEGVAGSVPEFAALMNVKAREIGATDTHFVTPNGLDDVDEGGAHRTTAADLARIMRYCIEESPKAEEFLAITRTQSYTFSDVDGRRSHTVNNKNAFLGMMDGALTGKTGFTGEAGYCYVGALRRDDRTYIVALLACGWPNHKNYKWTDTCNLMTYGLEQYEMREVFRAENWTQELAVAGGTAESVLVQLAGAGGAGLDDMSANGAGSAGTESLQITALAAEGEQAVFFWYVFNDLAAPVAAGQEVGRAYVTLGGVTLDEWSIRAASDVEAWMPERCLREILSQFFLLKSSA